ncbi:PEP-CTERM sorting domain-containing protein [Rubritalea tangerina]|uniref:PEP-CTERM sorting domain-containing protein n=1 Tax=Rubritalea tangerina TaxID=430798 RepID=A0ABW4ZBH3_9BACT
MNRMNALVKPSIAALALCALPTQAATINIAGLSVVEADEFDLNTGTAGNTVFKSGVLTGTTTRNQGSFSDNDTWKFRTENQWSGSGTFAGAYSSFGNGATANDALTLTTTVSGLANGTYDVYVVYVGRNDSNDDGGIAAALSGNTLVDYPDASGASGGLNSIDLGVGADVWSTFAVKIGTVSGTGFAVDAGLLSTTDTGSGIERNTYVGVAYQAVQSVPEPTATSLIGLGGLALMLRRRK